MTKEPNVLDSGALKEALQRLGAEAADETRARGGNDGAMSETSSLLAMAMGACAFRYLESGADRYELDRGLRQAARIVVDVVRSVSRPDPEDGRVPGSGLPLLRALAVLELAEPHFFEDMRAGAHILRGALAEPTRALAERLHLVPDEVVEAMRGGRGAFGLDPTSGAYVDLVAAGVTDSTHALHVAVMSAVDVVSALLRDEEPMTQRAPARSAAE